MVKARKRRLYVEGGGLQNSSLASECRRAFGKLFEKAGIARKPRVVACGGRQRAYEKFTLAHEEDEDDVWLLVDAEDIPSRSSSFEPWKHVERSDRDGWTKPDDATDDQLHLMVVCMETWLLADRAALKAIFGSTVDEGKLPKADATLERRKKSAVFDALTRATRQTPSGPYGKGSHSFKVLAEVSPTKLQELPWANRFLQAFAEEA